MGSFEPPLIEKKQFLLNQDGLGPAGEVPERGDGEDQPHQPQLQARRKIHNFLWKKFATFSEIAKDYVHITSLGGVMTHILPPRL